MKLEIVARIAADRVRSLVWAGEELVDWVSGGIRYEMDGTVTPRAVNYAYRFDAACGSASGRFAVIYERLGTKGLVLDEGRILREIDRSFYHAGVYEYPVCIARSASGRDVLIHCPEHYNRLEIDDVETGERVTLCDDRSPTDFFHSRLAVAEEGSHFASAGWIWQPIDAVGVYRLEDALDDPASLDGLGLGPPASTEISSATFIDDRHLLMTTSDETFADDEDFDGGKTPRPSHLVIWDPVASKIVSQMPIEEPLGTVMSLDANFAIGFHEHPKLVDLRTGKIVSRLEEIDSGRQTSSIIHHIESVPPLALDPSHGRFAISTPSEIVVVEAVAR